MIQSLKLIHTSQPIEAASQNSEVFSLETCQRALYLSFNESLLRNYSAMVKSEVEFYSGEEAYHFLLETLCGLKSHILAEYEIVSQFKKAYANYLSNKTKNTHLMNILEKLLADGKKIRSQYLMQIGQQSYAGIARKVLLEVAAAGEILILGSGQLAEDLIKLLKKRYQLRVAGRNEKRVAELCDTYGVQSHPWSGEFKAFSNSPFIVNTIGATQKVFNDEFFENWSQLYHQQQRLFIDLGSPSMLNTYYKPEHGVLQLEHVFERGRNFDREKMEKVSKAKAAIDELIEQRRTTFNINFPFGWEELQFA